MLFNLKKRKSYTVKEWSNEILKFSFLLLIANSLMIWQLNSEGWGINFTVGSEFNPTRALWNFFFKYHYPFVIGSVLYAFALIIPSLLLRNFKNWARIFFIPLSILGGVCITILYIFLLKELIHWPFYWILVIGVIITLFWVWKYIYELLSFLKNPIVKGLFE